MRPGKLGDNRAGARRGNYSPAMRALRLLLGTVCFGLLVLGASRAEAQYKNTSFGAYAGVALLLPPTNPDWWPELALTAPGTPLPDGRTAPSTHPFALANAMLSLELNFKISLESWFLKTGLNVGILQVSRDDRVAFPQQGTPQGGVVFWLEGMFGPRYYFLTDTVRPYFELGIRLAGLAYTTNVNAIIPTNWKVIPGVYAQLGLEFIVARDLAITFLARGSYHIVVNFPGFANVEGMAGIISYF
jgi:hypothetical protein